MGEGRTRARGRAGDREWHGDGKSENKIKKKYKTDMGNTREVRMKMSRKDRAMRRGRSRGKG